jgi:hypothetical protein
MKRPFRSFALLTIVLCAFGQMPAESFAPQEPDEFKVSVPVVCKTVKGHNDFVRLDPPELTTYDKLIVYVEPTGYSTRLVDGKRKAAFVQNGKVRAAGSKKVIFERNELLRFEPEVSGPGATFYLAATVGFKSMPPGDYVLELETVDEAAEPFRKTAQLVPFTIVRNETAGEGTNSDPAKSSAAKRKSLRGRPSVNGADSP